MMESDQKRAFLAVILSGAVLFLWQTFFAPKKNSPLSQPVPATSSQVSQTQGEAIKREFKSREGNRPEKLGKVERDPIPSKEFVLENSLATYIITDDLTVKDAGHSKSVFDFKSIVGGENPLIIQGFLNGAYRVIPLVFTQENGTNITGINDELGVRFRGVLEENGRFNFSLSTKRPLKLRLLFNSKEKNLENNQFRQFVAYTDEVNFLRIGDSESAEGLAKWFGIDFNYHLFAFVLKDKKYIKYRMAESGQIVVEFVEEMAQLEGGIVFSKKNYDDLKGLGDKLELSVDFGFFGILAVPILRGLQLFYDFIPNYGLAIIILTIFIRTIMFPLQFKSFKSMKKMQKIQPELQKLKEKLKDDPQRMQKETMALFKSAGANPLGGCLPMIAQMPIFFAFYQVLYSAVELVGAPFIMWISDLSVKDPYYVLPVLMAVTMLVQQKFQPSTTVDPTQQKIMMIMPIVFGFIMKDLPAGLVLYIFVSTLYGIIQQLIVYRTVD